MEPTAETSARPVIVFDVLGTLVDQAGSMQRRIAEVTGLPDTVAHDVTGRWLAHVAEQEAAIRAGGRGFAPSHELDREALDRLVAERLLPDDATTRLADVSERLEPWPDTVAGLDLLARDVTVLGLSNASRRVLAGLSAAAGLRWHQVLSAEDVGTYKPAPDLYELAMTSAPGGTDTPGGTNAPRARAPFMVAAHAWDLRAGAAVGMRTAYVPRPDGDAPREDDAFDLRATDLADLRVQLLDHARP